MKRAKRFSNVVTVVEVEMIDFNLIDEVKTVISNTNKFVFESKTNNLKYDSDYYKSNYSGLYNKLLDTVNNDDLIKSLENNKAFSYLVNEVSEALYSLEYHDEQAYFEYVERKDLEELKRELDRLEAINADAYSIQMIKNLYNEHYEVWEVFNGYYE